MINDSDGISISCSVTNTDIALSNGGTGAIITINTGALLAGKMYHVTLDANAYKTRQILILVVLVVLLGHSIPLVGVSYHHIAAYCCCVCALYCYHFCSSLVFS